MNTSDDEPSFGVNGRLRPRKSAVPSPQTTKSLRKSEGKLAQEKPKRTSTPSKVLNKPDDLANKSDSSPAPHFLCPYCDKKFAAKQAISKHVRRMHSSVFKQDSSISCLYCNHTEVESNDIIRHMVDSHPNQYFACLNCHARFPSTTELAEHKLNICERQKVNFGNKIDQKTRKTKKPIKTIKIDDMKEFSDAKAFPTGSFNGIVISCELKPTQDVDEADIEDNITTNLILPPNKNLGGTSVLEKNAVILLDDIQWNKRIPSNFSFHNTDTDQILSRLGVVHRSPRAANETTKRDWLRTLDDATQKFEKCFDTSFYSKVASNVQENLTKFLDGSFNFNPDPDSTIKTRKWKNSVVINTAEGFPILLAYEQYSRNTFDGYMPRAIAPKHKWKWDNLESDRTVLSADQIKRDSHTNNCIITLVSSLDIWTQLCMRRKYEEKYNYSPLAKKTDKQNAIEKDLKEILESRVIPTSSSHVVKHKYKPPPVQQSENLEFPASLGLAPSTPKYELQPAVLSGEWVRPRCFVCCACGAPTSDSRALSAHMANIHPNAQVQHYEVVGELLLNADILKHLYVPPSQMHNRTRPLRGIRECTKCQKSIALEDLHQHMLDCAGDTPAVRRKVRYRPFGVRRRRPRLPDNRIRKKIRKDIRNRQANRKAHMRSRPRNRTEVGDAETIRKMLADLPAKRHRVLVNPGNSVLRSRNNLEKQRNKLLMKRRLSEDHKNRRLRVLKSTNYNEQAGTSANEDQIKTFIKNDDDKPPKRTVKRVATKTTRQNEVLKRKVALNRAKRKLKSEQALAENENYTDSNVPSTSGAEPVQLSIENNPQKMDINNGSYNTRENSNRGSNDSNDGPPNNGEQPPGNVGPNGDNIRSRAPVQNTPLKHSIARLTADCETHDKSVQFHHSFLVQQECNNLNQHVPTGQLLLFENEAAVTRLDKPPLPSGHRGILDPYSLQKSKLNKPRKGLNDCIAMLRNKLDVEPTPGLTSSQISVQCGSDDPLDAEPIGAPIAIEDKHVDTSKPAEVFSRHNMNLDLEYTRHYETFSQENKFATELHPVSLPYEMMPPLPSLPSAEANLMPQLEISPKQKTSGTTKRQSSRRRRAVIEAIPPIVPETVPTKRQSDRVSQRRSASQRIVVNINTETDKNEMQDVQSNLKDPRQISPNQVINTIQINTEVCKDQYINERSVRKLSTEQISPRYVNVNEIHNSQSRSGSLSRQVSPGRAYDTLSSNRSGHKLVSPQPGIDIDALTARKLSPKQLSPKQSGQVSPRQSAQVSPRQNTHASPRHSSQVSPRQSSQVSPRQTCQVSPSPNSQISPKQINLDTNRSSSNLSPPTSLQKQTTTKHYDGVSTKMATPIQLSPRQVSQAHDLNIITSKAGYSQSSMMPPKQVSPKPMSYSCDTLPYSKSLSSSLPSPRQISQTLDIQTSTKLSPRERSPKQVSPRLVSPRHSLDINTEMTLRSKETPSLRYSNVSMEPLQSEDLRAHSRVSSHGDHSHPRASSNSRSSSSTSNLRSPSQPRESLSHPQGHPAILLYPPPPPPPPPAPSAAGVPPQVITHLQVDSQVHQNWQSKAYHDMIRQNHPDMTNEHVTRKVSLDTYPETDFARISSNIPPAHASTIIEPLVSVPLDLSGKASNVETDNVSKHDPVFDQSYESYETLDLSNKTSSFTSRDATDVVVDLRVKSVSHSSSLRPLELRSNTSQNVDVITDLTLRAKHEESIPKDLSVRTKHSSGIRATKCNDQRYGVHDMYNQKPMQPARTLVEEEISVLETPTDLSGRLMTIASKSSDVYINKESASILNTAQISHISHEKLQLTLPNIDYDINAPADLSDKSTKHKKANLSSDLLKIIPQTPKEVNEPLANTTSKIIGDNNSQNSMVDPTLDIPLFKIKVPTSNALQTLHMKEVNDDTRSKSVEISKAITTIASTLAVYTLPSLVTGSQISRHDNTKPVYTLANACISVTKVDGSDEVPFTSTLLSVPSTTASTPVYTLAGNTIASQARDELKSTIEYSISQPVVNKPSSIQVAYDKVSEADPEVNVENSSMVENHRLKDEALNATATHGDQDLETARKIAMLPKELVEILGTMPPGHRNQLLNVLPQYVSNTNTQVEGVHTAEALRGISVSPSMSRQSTFSDSIAKFESTTNYRNAIPNIASDNRFSIANLGLSQPNDGVDSDIKQHFPLTSLPSSLLCAISKSSEDIKPPIRESNSISEFKHKILSDTAEIHSLKGSTPAIIDLTEDDAPSNEVIKTTDSVQQQLPPSVLVSSQPIQPVINLTSVAKPKGSNEKTSSLRAVRIKAPSERHKSMSTELHLSKTIIEKDFSVSNHESEIQFDKTLAIQQSEVSSTQQQQKKDSALFTSQLSPTPTELSTRAVESGKNEEIMPNDPNKSLDEVEGKNVAKAVLVTSSISTSDLITKECTDEDVLKQNVRDDVQNELAPCDIDIVLRTATNDTKDRITVTDHLIESSTSLDKACEKDNINVTEPQEDSDDDISLAVIVKQKKLDQQSTKEGKKKLEPKKKKKTKSAKKCDKNVIEDQVLEIASYVSTNPIDSASVIVQDKLDEKHNDEYSQGQVLMASVPSEDEEKYSKKKNKTRKTRHSKNLLTTTVNIGFDVQTQDHDSVSSSSCKHQDNDEKLMDDSKFNPVKEIDQKASLSGVEELSKTVEVTQDNHNTPHDAKVHSNLLENYEEKSLSAKKKEKTSKKKESLKLHQPEAVLPIVHDKEINETKVINKCEEKQTEVIEPDSCSLVEFSDTQESIDTEDSNFENAGKSSKRNKRTKRSKKVEIIKDSSEIQEHNVTPLRRSRRGKSLYVDGKTSDVESTATESEILVEHKTPLTKKQLIFSKLLLDEENSTPKAHSTPISKSDRTEGESAVVTNSSIDISSSVNETELTKPILEKNKATKRRQSPQLKRKVKKTKSFETAQQAEEDTSADTVQADKDINKVDLIPQTEKCVTVVETNKLNVKEVQDMDITDNSDMNKSVKEPKNQRKLKHSLEKDDHLIKSPSPAEKRKNSETFEFEQSTKNKKCKFNTKVDTDDIAKEIDKKDTKTKNIATYLEVRTTCYNKPIAAARRTRSKSAVVKSSGTLLYDPYDIDLDDMIERSEPISLNKGRASEVQPESISNLTNTSKTVSKSQRKTPMVSDDKTSLKERKAAITSEKINTPNEESEDAVFEEDLLQDVRGSISDSDDSSKSDVPLQKYVVEKEKRMCNKERAPSSDKDGDEDADQGELGGDKNTSDDGKSRKTLAVFNNVEGGAAQTETEEQLRSEQFMESFGFFSERKPRKSNLLASKKISETFHIIANESDDVYFGYKDRSAKKPHGENNKKSAEGESSKSTSGPSKKAKRGRKKKDYPKPVPCYCTLCKKEFKRPDNFLRHQMSLIHISNISEIELKVKTLPVPEEPNYLIAYKQYLDRLKVLTDKLAKKRKHGKGSRKIKLPTIEEILVDLNKTISEQKHCHRGELSRDEALFLDCCELLKESYKKAKPKTDALVIFSDSCLPQHSVSEHLNHKISDDTKSDGDVDSITAKTILESEEVRNLENDLISGLKEAANASLNSKMNYLNVMPVEQPQEQTESSHTADLTEYEKVEEPEVVEKPHIPEKTKKEQREVLIDEKDFVYKEKMYPDIIEDIDMFEDKFDKIKRKCRSQAAAAKQTPVVAETHEGHKARRKSEKKKGKKAKKSHQNSHVPTKGALKGFDGIKVSINTSDINMSAIVAPAEPSSKKKKKSNSKKKRDKKDSEDSNKYDSDQRAKESTSQKKVDVYEFMDNDEAELFEFRPSTLMERFKNILGKETPSTSKAKPTEEADDSSESASDGDDFVYMSDDYVGSEDETENSLLSCEMGAGKLTNEPKKTASPMKRKDAVEKNAVMGKIFKHNAVRPEKKISKSKEPAKSKANLDQLFDSLLEDEPSSSTLKSASPRKDDTDSLKEYSKLPASKYEPSSSTYEAPRESPPKEFAYPRKLSSSYHKYDSIPTTSKKPQRPSLQAEEFIFSTKRYDSEDDDDYGPSTSTDYYGPSSSKKYDMNSPKYGKSIDYITSKYMGSSMRNEDGSYKRRYSSDKSPTRKTDEGISTSYDYGADVFEQSYDEAGVARQRARRKCTVGKQNVLAESWSSESEPERGPPRPTSAESVLSIGVRKKKGKKKEGHPIGGRRAQRPFKKHEESRVSSSRRSSHNGTGAGYGASSGSVSTGVQVSLGPPCAGPTATARPRARAHSAWDEDEQERTQQHGWIVGDSHKKLVTMLAHAKGRKRNSDDKRHYVD